MIRILNRFYRDESGVTSLEYGFIGILVAIVIVTALGTIGTQLKSTFVRVGTALTTANGG